MNSKAKVFSNLVWRFFERCGAQLVSLAVSILLARLLAPELYGLVSKVVIITSILGIFAIAAALNGYVFKKVNIFERILFIAGGLTLLIPGALTDVIGIVLVAAAIVLQIVGKRRAKVL